MLTSKAHFKINEEEFLPKSLKVSYESLASENSGRTDNGKMYIEWIYRKLRTIEIEMPPCSSEELARLLNLVQGKEYEIEYYDPLDNKIELRGVYTSNSSADMYSGVIRGGLYQGVAFKAIEIEGEAE